MRIYWWKQSDKGFENANNYDSLTQGHKSMASYCQVYFIEPFWLHTCCACVSQANCMILCRPSHSISLITVMTRYWWGSMYSVMLQVWGLKALGKISDIDHQLRWWSSHHYHVSLIKPYGHVSTCLFNGWWCLGGCRLSHGCGHDNSVKP